MSKPLSYIDRYRANPDGSWEWACYWCNEPLLVHPEDEVCAVTTKAGQFAGIQCSVCEIKHKGKFARRALEAGHGN
jgi:hypothetical protein